MRLPLAIVLAVAIAVAAVLVVRDDDAATTSTSPVTLVGDSLNVGIEPYLGEALDGRVDPHDLVGRGTAEGVDVLADLRRRLAQVVVVSLGTNDAEGTEAEFRGLVDRAVELVGPDRCLVWATIVRDGSPRTGFNEILADTASAHPNVRLVDWASIVGENPGLLASDAVHATPEGYRRRAAATARAVDSCPSAEG